MSNQKIYRAGLIPYIIDGDRIEMMFMIPSNPKYGGGRSEGVKPQIAKGKMDPGETSKETAIREAKEELGLFEPNIVGEVPYLGKFLGRTDVYLAKMKDKDMFGDFHFETKAIQWLTSHEFELEGRDIHKPIVRSAMRYIQKRG